MAHSRARVTSLLLLTFAAGAAAGIAVDRHLLDGGREPALRGQSGSRGETTIERFADDLGLTAEQRARIQPILEDTRKRMTEVFDEVRPAYRELVDSARARIEAVLTPEQVASYRELLERHERAHTERNKE